MTDSNFRGPVSSMGSMEDVSTQPSQPTDGPAYLYQGYAVPNLRGGSFQKDGTGAGRVPGFLVNPRIVTIDQIPFAATTTILAAAATTLTATPVTLLTVAPGNATAAIPSPATGVPIIPFNSTSVVTAAIALDFGFTTGTTAAGGTTVTTVDNTLFTLGQWLVIGGAGNAGKTASLITQVVAISTANTTGISIFPAALGTLTNAPIGSANQWNQFTPPGTQFSPGVAGTGAANSIAAGLVRAFNPVAGIARNVCVAGQTAAGGAFLVTGWDIYHQAMSETITSTAGTATVYGKKAFKFIAAITPQFTDATGTYSFGIGDTFGLPLLSPREGGVNWSWAGVNKINATGFLAPDATSPATAATGDTRGTLQTSAKGNGTGLASNLASDGARRLYIEQTITMWNDISGTQLNPVPQLGVTQV